jgi:hypothetical protein
MNLFTGLTLLKSCEGFRNFIYRDPFRSLSVNSAI